MVSSLAEYTAADLEALERERPELGRVEIMTWWPRTACTPSTVPDAPTSTTANGTLDGVEHTGPSATWQLDGWPPFTFERAALLNPRPS